MKLRESLSRIPARPIIFIGKSRAGNWAVLEESGRFGGLFVSRVQALKYALSENGDHPEAIVEVRCEVGFAVMSKMITPMQCMRDRVHQVI
ncbi:hypothetical protein SAMN05192541_12279 [Bradyrhizobium arachidis]|nr:hypothetical protein [Bradyrhizobium arachidis]SFV14926.1 hypothetical protein SAMN05192541_12279 [Bradyrhizobium arachidis]